MKHFLMAVALILVLSVSSFGGDMHGSDSPAPVPSPTPQLIKSASSEPTMSVLGETHTGDSALTFDDALDVLLSVFGLVF